MRARSASVARAAHRPPTASLDIVCCSVVDGRLMALVTTGAPAAIPWAPLDTTVAVAAAAARLARDLLGRAPAWSTQAGAYGADRRHPSDAPLSVAYAIVMPTGTDAPEGLVWRPVAELGALAPRQRAILDGAIATLRDRMDLAPVAFRMLPATFTLAELQQMYELLLGRRLHKASFRRALQAAFLVEPTGEWRSEGRGRPAQLFRFAPRRRRGTRRPVRFELLG